MGWRSVVTACIPTFRRVGYSPGTISNRWLKFSQPFTRRTCSSIHSLISPAVFEPLLDIRGALLGIGKCQKTCQLIFF